MQHLVILYVYLSFLCVCASFCSAILGLWVSRASQFSLTVNEASTYYGTMSTFKTYVNMEIQWKSLEIPVKRSKRFHVHSVSSFYSISISSVRQRKITGAVVSFSKAKKIYFSYSIHASLSQFSLSAWKHFNALFLLFPLFLNLSLCQTVFFSFESKCFWHFVTIINNFLLVYNFFASFSLCYLSSVDVKKKKQMINIEILPDSYIHTRYLS